MQNFLSLYPPPPKKSSTRIMSYRTFIHINYMIDELNLLCIQYRNQNQCLIHNLRFRDDRYLKHLLYPIITNDDVLLSN